MFSNRLIKATQKMFDNELTYSVYDKDGKIYKDQKDIVSNNIVVNQGKEIIRDCLKYENKFEPVPYFSSNIEGEFSLSGSTAYLTNYKWKALDNNDSTFFQTTGEPTLSVYNENKIITNSVRVRWNSDRSGSFKVYINDDNTNTNEVVSDSYVTGTHDNTYTFNSEAGKYIKVVFTDTGWTQIITFKIENDGTRNGLRNIKLSTNTTTPIATDTELGGTTYDVGLTTDFAEKNLETGMLFNTQTLEHDTLVTPFRYESATLLQVYKMGMYDYNGGTPRLFSAMLLNGSNGTEIPAGGVMVGSYKIRLNKGTSGSGYLTDWGVKATIHALRYGNTDYNLNSVGYGSGASGIDLMPTMTSNTTPTPYVISADSESSAYPAWYAANKDTSDDNGWLGTMFENGWWCIDYGVNIRVTRIDIQGYYSGTYYNPTDFTIEGSTTGLFTGEEDVLKVVTNAIWTDREIKTFQLSSVGYYRYYRINITGTASDFLAPWLNEVWMFNEESSNEVINGLFATETATSINENLTNELLISASHTNSTGSTEQVEEIGWGTANIATGELYSKFAHSHTISDTETYPISFTNKVNNVN